MILRAGKMWLKSNWLRKGCYFAIIAHSSILCVDNFHSTFNNYFIEFLSCNQSQRGRLIKKVNSASLIECYWFKYLFFYRMFLAFSAYTWQPNYIGFSSHRFIQIPVASAISLFWLPVPLIPFTHKIYRVFLHFKAC